jgi:hypothetical protein
MALTRCFLLGDGEGFRALLPSNEALAHCWEFDPIAAAGFASEDRDALGLIDGLVALVAFIAEQNQVPRDELVRRLGIWLAVPPAAN